MTIKNEKTGIRYRILIDRYEGNARVDDTSTGKLVHIIHDVCKSYVGEFTIENLEGGYQYENGELKRFCKLAVSFPNAEKAVIDELAADLCAFFQRSSVEVEAIAMTSYEVTDAI